MVNSREIVTNAEKQANEWRSHVRDAADLFHDEEGDLLPRSEALTLLETELDLSRGTATRTLTALVGDLVDPVVQVPLDGERYIGVIEYNEYDGAYGYELFDDVSGSSKRVVCAKCVKEESVDTNITHATGGQGTFDSDASYDELLDAVHQHYENAHYAIPEDVKTGASLLSGTTIANNSAIHTGNESNLSFFDGTNLTASTTGDAGTLDGEEARDLAPTYSDGTTNIHQVMQNRFGAEGSTTTSTGYVTIAGSDLTFNPDEYRDSNGDLYVRIRYHLKHDADSGTVYARVYRQNAATVVSGSEVSISLNDSWGSATTGWINLTDSGFESYQIQLKSSDGQTVSYNSVVMHFGNPT